MTNTQRKQWTLKVHYNQWWVPKAAVAICLGSHVFTGRPYLSQWVLDHEETHAYQYASTGFWRYLWLWFKWTWQFGYNRNPFEIAANARANKLERQRWLNGYVDESYFSTERPGVVTRLVAQSVVGVARRSPRFSRWLKRFATKRLVAAEQAGFLGPQFSDDEQTLILFNRAVNQGQYRHWQVRERTND